MVISKPVTNVLHLQTTAHLKRRLKTMHLIGMTADMQHEQFAGRAILYKHK